MTQKTYARCVALLDAPLVGTYTVGKEYEVLPNDGWLGCDFTIRDDEGWLIPCWWNEDPDCIWERIER